MKDDKYFKLIFDLRKENIGISCAFMTIREDGTLCRWPGIVELDEEQKEIISLIIQRKGFFIGTKPEHQNRGKYLPIETISSILSEFPDWIRIKKLSNRYGL